MASVVCLDSQILIWGLKKEAIPEQQYMIDRAERFFRKLDSTRTMIMVPAVVVAEIIAPVPPERHPDIWRLMGKNFIVSPFDTKASNQYSLIYQKVKGLKNDPAFFLDPCTSRKHIIADCMIVATAVAHGAIMIYSNDKHIQCLGDGVINVAPMPDIAEQPTLFDEAE